MDPPALTFSQSNGSETMGTQSLKADRYASVEAPITAALFDSDSTIPEEDYRNDISDDEDRKVVESARECMKKYREQTYRYKQQRESHRMATEDERFQICEGNNGKSILEQLHEKVSQQQDEKESKEEVAQEQPKEEEDAVLVKHSESGKEQERRRNGTAAATEEEQRYAAATGIALSAGSVAYAVNGAQLPGQNYEPDNLGFFVGLVEFLSSLTVVPLSTVLNEVCASPKHVDPVVSKMHIDMPLRSFQDMDDTEEANIWGPTKEEQMKTRKIAGIAKAINFSSNRIDDKNPAAIALYDEKRLKHEEHMVHLPAEYYDIIDIEDDEDEDEEYDDEPGDLEQRRDVPEAIIVKDLKADDVSVLEDTSIYSSDEKQSFKAWSLSPRRKRRLRARARAVAKKQI